MVSAVGLAELLLAPVLVSRILISTGRAVKAALSLEVEALQRTAHSYDRSAWRWLSWSSGIKLKFVRVIQPLFFR